jgi:hypothetical protein
MLTRSWGVALGNSRAVVSPSVCHSANPWPSPEAQSAEKAACDVTPNEYHFRNGVTVHNRSLFKAI